MLGLAATVQMASRLNRDLWSAPRPLHIELRRGDHGDFEWFLGEADGQGASMSTLILEDDELTDLELELFTAELADALAGRCGQMTSRHPGQPVRLRPITP